MKLLFSFVPAVIFATAAVAELSTPKYLCSEVPFDGGYTRVLVMPDGTLEHVVAFTDASKPHIWQVPANSKPGIDYLVVAGGGGGGAGQGGGGGGAGGMLTGIIEQDLLNENLSIIVGLGGKKGTTSNPATNGENSSVKLGEDVLVEAIGGGAGGSGYSVEYVNGSDGGSGGGGAGSAKALYASATLGGKGIEGQGYAGSGRSFTLTVNYSMGSGGGGASESPTAITKAYNSAQSVKKQDYDGGDGKQSAITGESRYYAGGGGGGSYLGGTYGFLGGKGGGGQGAAALASAYNSVATAGEDGLGGGGGGGSNTSSSKTGNGANGGSGIVVLRYALNNDYFQGIAVGSIGGEFGVPNPAYGGYEILPDSNTFTCYKYTELSEGERAVCVGWELWNKDETRMLKSGTDDNALPPYEETDIDKVVSFTRDSDDVGVVLKWVFVKEYYVATVAKYASSDEECTRGSLKEDKSGWYRAGDQIKVEIASTDNFIGWGGWGTGADRSIEKAKTITVVEAPMTIAAYFTANKRDNLVLNGDFEMNNDSSYSYTIIQNFNRLTAGSWSVLQTSGYSAYPTGILAASDDDGAKNSALKPYQGLSCTLAGYSASNQHKNDSYVGCYVNILSPGIYDLSFFNRTSSKANSAGWTVEVQLISEAEDGTETIQNIAEISQEKDQSWKQYSSEEGKGADDVPKLEKVIIRKSGVYLLRFFLRKANVEHKSSTAAGNGISAFDNIELKLDKPFGFSIKVR